MTSAVGAVDAQWGTLQDTFRWFQEQRGQVRYLFAGVLLALLEEEYEDFEYEGTFEESLQSRSPFGFQALIQGVEVQAIWYALYGDEITGDASGFVDDVNKALEARNSGIKLRRDLLAYRFIPA